MNNLVIKDLYVDVSGEKYIDIPKLYQLSCDVYIIFGERTGGKTYSVFKGMLDEYAQTGAEFCYMRTREDYIRGTKGLRAIANNKKYCEEILWKSEASLTYRAGEYYKCEIGRNNQNIYTAIGHAMSIGGWTKYKSNGYDNVKTIFFDEFIEDPETKTIRILSHDEFIKGYMQNLSTIIRRRKDVKIVCCANSLDANSPLFDYYGINTRKLQQGRIYIFNRKIGTTDTMKICCLYTLPPERVNVEKHIAVFENETSAMTILGSWQEVVYPSKFKNNLWNRYLCKCNNIYLSDIDLTLAIPSDNETPLILINGRYGATEAIVVQDLYLFAQRIRAIILYYEQIKRIISESQTASTKFNDLIKRITIDKI